MLNANDAKTKGNFRLLHGDVTTSGTHKNLQLPKMFLCAKCGCLAPDGPGGVCRQRNKHKDGQKFGVVQEGFGSGDRCLGCY